MHTEDTSSGAESEIDELSDSAGAGDIQVYDQALPVAGSAHTRLSDSHIEWQVSEGWPDLSHQRRAWADEYVINGYDHRAAAVSVGLKADRGIGLTREPLLRHYIDHIQRQMNVPAIVTKQMLDAQYETLMDIAMGNIEIPCVTGSGEEFTAKKFQGDLVMKIMQERAKLAGITKEDEGRGGVTNVIIDVGALLGAGNTVVSEQ